MTCDRTTFCVCRTIMSGFHALFEAQRKIAKRRAQHVAATIKCSVCSQRFKNHGAVASHMRFAHQTLPKQNNKLDFSKAKAARAKQHAQLSESNNESDSDHSLSESDSEEEPPQKKRKTRARFTNQKKLELAREFKAQRVQNPFGYEEQFASDHPAVPINTVKNWVRSKDFAQLEADGLHEDIKVRNAKVSSRRLEYLNKGQFPEHEEKLFEKFVERREKHRIVPRIWFRTHMKKLLKKNPPQNDEWKSFSASPGWCYNFFDRFNITKRRRSNAKSKSPQERLPQVQKFHRTVKLFRQPPPQRDQKYGRFAAEHTYHVDQVPWEPAKRLFETTYEVKGKRRVQIKSPKVDLSKRQSTLQLTFAAGSPQSVRPGICFRAQPKKVKQRDDGTWIVDPSRPESKDLANERKKMPDSIDVFYQPKAWFDTETCIAYARSFRKQTGPHEKLLGLDNLTAHVTPRFKRYMKTQANTLLLFTPDDCTDLCAVTDAGAFLYTIRVLRKPPQFVVPRASEKAGAF